MKTKWLGFAITALLALQPAWVFADDDGDAESSLPGLLKLYREIGLPLPPKDAKLVRQENGRFWLNGVRQPQEYRLGFLFRLQEKQGGLIYLEGTHEFHYETKHGCEEVAPTKTAASETFGFRPDIIVAVQCQSLGWNDLAADIFSSVRDSSNDSPQKEILHSAWYFWTQRIADPKFDRRTISSVLKRIMALDRDQATKEHNSLVQTLDLAMAPNKAKPGTAQALIDDLVDVTDIDTGSDFPKEVEARESSYWKLVRLGFDAVPAFLEHLEDRRLSRTYRPSYTGSSGRLEHLLVSDLVAELLEELAGSQASKNWRTRILETSDTSEFLMKSDVLVWWREAQKEGEESYLIRHVLLPGKRGIHFDPAWPNEHQLHVLGTKYPRDLEATYRDILNKQPRMDSWPVAKEIAASNLSASEKTRIFLAGTAAKNLDHRSTAIGQLLKLDHELAVTILIKTLAELPDKPQEPCWSSPEGQLAVLAVKVDDARSWQALTRVATKADPALRIEILNSVTYVEAQSVRRLQFLSGFLADLRIRELKAQRAITEDPLAFSDFTKLEVRNVAALALESILKMNAQSKENWQQKDWARLREQVRDQLLLKGVEAAESLESCRNRLGNAVNRSFHFTIPDARPKAFLGISNFSSRAADLCQTSLPRIIRRRGHVHGDLQQH